MLVRVFSADKHCRSQDNHSLLQYVLSTAIATIIWTSSGFVLACVVRTHNKLGRMVRGYDQQVWDQHKLDIATRGSYAKFTQNEMMGQHLLGTGEKVSHIVSRCVFLCHRPAMATINLSNHPLLPKTRKRPFPLTV